LHQLFIIYISYYIILDSLQEARAKAKIAEQTSDLDHEVVRKRARNHDGTSNLVEIPDPPTYNPDTNDIGRYDHSF
jgi:hypothetical protein